MTDERWKECRHHHHGCACHEHEWEERVETLKRERDKACANYQFMVDRAADEKLDGYRELGQRCADLESEVERIKGEAEGYGEVIADLAKQIKSHEAHTWQAERAAMVALLRDPSKAQSVFTSIDLLTSANRIEVGEHWPEGGAMSAKEQNRDLQICRLAYRIGRKDSCGYARRSFGAVHTDSDKVDRIASMVWSSISDSCERDPFEVLGQAQQKKLRIVAQTALSLVAEVMNRALNEAPEDPVNFDAIVRAVDFLGDIEQGEHWPEGGTP